MIISIRILKTILCYSIKLPWHLMIYRLNIRIMWLTIITEILLVVQVKLLIIKVRIMLAITVMVTNLIAIAKVMLKRMNLIITYWIKLGVRIISIMIRVLLILSKILKTSNMKVNNLLITQTTFYLKANLDYKITPIVITTLWTLQCQIKQPLMINNNKHSNNKRS